MGFFSQNNLTRPVRLSEMTRTFAFDSLNHKYGLDTLKKPAVSIDEILSFHALPPIMQYDLGILRIAEKSPVRICDGEKVSGAATLGLAIDHTVPVTYKGNELFDSVSHLTVDFETVLKKGVGFIERKVEKHLELYRGTEKEPFLNSCKNCITAFHLWHERYLHALFGKEKYKANYENLLNVPFKPASSFHEAVQSLWFTFAFLRLCGNWPGIGRIDYLLGDYLKKDLENNRITLNEAREILAHFFIKGCEWITGKPTDSGDAQHYQNLVLGGIAEDGNEVTNEVTYLVLDIIEELGISDFPTTVRINKNTDEKLLRRVAEVIRFGGGVLAVYNEDLVLSALISDGYGEREARRFANDGCWEVQIPGKTCFSYSPFDSLQILQKNTLAEYSQELPFSSYEEIYSAYINDLRKFLESKARMFSRDFHKKTDDNEPWRWKTRQPCTVVSLFEEGCIEKGLSYLEGGPVYNLKAPHIGGLADTVNSLYAIKKLVFDLKKVSLNRFMTILRNNWEGEEGLRQFALNGLEYFGNDNDEVDEIAARLLSDFSDICASLEGTCGYHLPAGVSTFGRQLIWMPKRLASPHGRRQGEVLAANCSPTPNTDKEGITSVIKSYCKIDHKKIATGSALDVKVLPSNVEGETGLAALVGLIRSFVNLGGFFMQPDIVDADLLREAQKHPEDYQTLSVRVSGWNARFVTLDRHWQNMVIEQNEH